MFEVHEKYTFEPLLAESPLDEDMLERMKFRIRVKGGVGATGYLRTDTFRQFGLPTTWEKEWHTMPISDCRKGSGETSGFGQ